VEKADLNKGYQSPKRKLGVTTHFSEIIEQGSILAFFETRQPGKDVRKDTCPDKILLAPSKLCNN